MAIRVGSRRALLGNVSAADNNPGTTNLISWWSLDETSGTRNDSHGTNHLTDNNTVLSAAGKQSNAGDFEKDYNEHLSIVDNATLNLGDADFTFCVWVKAESVDTLRGHRLITKMASASAFEYWLSYDEASTDDFNWNVSGNGSTYAQALSGVGNLTLGQWYFIVCWHDSVNDEIGIQIDNGTPVTASHSAGLYDGTAFFSIGYSDLDSDARWGWDGLIDEVAYFSAVLTADERTWLYNSGAGRAYSELS